MYVSQWVRAKHVPKGARTTRVPVGACQSTSQRVRVYYTVRVPMGACEARPKGCAYYTCPSGCVPEHVPEGARKNPISPPPHPRKRHRFPERLTTLRMFLGPGSGARARIHEKQRKSHNFSVRFVRCVVFRAPALVFLRRAPRKNK